MPYVEENGLQVVFYFINLFYKNQHLQPADKSGSYIIVQIPPQSLHENYFRSEDYPSGAPPDQGNAKLAGFSFLSFRLWPKEIPKPKLKFSIDNLLAWENTDVFQLMTANEFPKAFWNYKSQDEVYKYSVIDETKLLNQLGINLYKTILKNILTEEQSYVSIFELPAGLILTPHKADDRIQIPVIQNNYSLSRRKYPIPSKTVEGSRIVRERWNAEIRYQLPDKQNPNVVTSLPPALRAIGMIVPHGTNLASANLDDPCKYVPVKLEADNYLPSMLDEFELLMLNNLFKKEPQYDLQVNGPFLLTSLGASMKFLYKNYVFTDAEKGLSLVEYEHHFQDGRDNYIKVARIGCIAPTGQKALHIKIAERKIVGGVSFMDYKEYVEIIEKEKVYPKHDGSSIGDAYDVLAGRPKNYVNQFCFNKVRAGVTRTEPISPQGDDPNPFWAFKNIKDVNKDDLNNLLKVPFTYWDCNDKELKEIRAAIYFMRRDLFCAKTNIDLPRFDDQICLHLPFGEQVIAFTKDVPDTPPKSKDAATTPVAQTNKVNQILTDYIDYYFNIATASASGNIFDHAEYVIFPQVTRAKVYIDHIQEYAHEKIPSVIEYVTDYLEKTFDTAENNAKLFIQHTLDFRAGEIKNLAGTKLHVPELNASYQKILNVFNNAGDKIGALTNPGIQIERFSLIQQAITLPEKVNDQWKGGSGRVLKTVEVFKDKAATILNGIDLRMILDEFLPAGLTPNFNISKVLTEIDKVTDYIKMIGNSQIVLNTMDAVKQIDADVKAFEAEVIHYQGEVQNAENQVLQAKNELTAAIPDLNKIKNGARLCFEKQRVSIIATVDATEASVITFVQNEFIRQYNNASAQFLEILWHDQKIRDIKTAVNAAITSAITQLAGVQSTTMNQLTILEAQKSAILDAALEDLFKNTINTYTTLKQVYDLNIAFTQPISTAHNFPVSAKFGDYITVGGVQGYIELSTGIGSMIQKYQMGSATAAELIAYKQKLDTVTAKIETSLYYYIQLLFSNHDLILRYVADKDKEIVQAFFDYLDTIQKGAIGYYIDRYFQLEKDYKNTIQTLIGTEQLFIEVQKCVSENAASRKSLVDNYVAGLIGGQDYATLNKLWLYVQNDDTRFFTELSNAIMNSDYIQQIPGVVKIKAAIVSKIATLNGYNDSLNASLDKYKAELQLQGEDMIKKVNAEFDKQIAGIVDVQAIQEANEQLLRVIQFLTTPQKQTLNYQWETSNFKPADAGILKFTPEISPATKLTVKVISNVYFDPSKYPSVVDHIDTYSENTLTNFGVTFLSVITVHFTKLKFVAGSGVPTSVSVQIASVTFDGALSFIQQLQDLLGNLGDGFGISINPDSVAIMYNSPTFSIGSPGFTFSNISFGVILRIFFDQKPVQLTFSLARADSKAVIAVSIYGGCFFCALTMEAKRGIVGIEMAMEMGAYVGISLGPIKGEVKFMVGLYYKKDDSGVLMEGYFIAEGTLSVWVLSVSARLYMYVRSQNSTVTGGCTASYSVKLGFIKKSFSGSYSKTIAGAENNSSGNRFSPSTISELRQYHSLKNAQPDEIDLSDIFEDDHYQVMNKQEWSSFYELFYSKN